MRRLSLGTILALSTACLLLAATPAWASHRPPVHCAQRDAHGLCVVQVGDPGHGGGPGSGTSGGTGGTQRCTDIDGKVIPCERHGLGVWDASLNCYLELTNPQPPKSDPVWAGHTTGAIYDCLTWPPRTTGNGWVWFANPPAGPDPRALALEAEKTLQLPLPSGDRSPNPSKTYHGYPYTYVNLWTWFWTDSASWKTRTATARAGGVSATVTVTPTALLFDPGDGSSSVSCAGPGRAWTSADGDGAPTDGGCGYQYRSATTQPLTSTQSIRWAVTWRASDGQTGSLPDLTTSRSGQLMVLQVESVVTR
jgi:hypothetical protein